MSENNVLSVDDASSVVNNIDRLDMNASQVDRILVVQAIHSENDNEIADEIEIELPVEFEKLISIDTSQIAKICRTCLCEKTEMHSLFDTWDVETLAEMLTNLTAVQFTFGDGLPESLCRDCVELIGKCNAFKQLCVRSESMLRLLLNQGQLHVQTQDKVGEEAEIEPHSKTIIMNVDADQNEGLEDENQSTEIENTCTENNLPSAVDEISSDVNNTSIAIHTMPFSKQHSADKISTLSVTLNPCININPRRKIKGHKIKKHKSLNVNNVKKCKIKSTNNDQDLVEGLVGPDNFLEIKVENEDVILDSDNSANDAVLPYTEDFQFQCSSCGKEFASFKKLNRHEKTHLSIKPFKCNVCGKGFNESGDLRRHERLHKRKVEVINVLQLAEDNSLLNIKVPCTQCHLTFSSEGDLAIHRSIHMDYNGKKICHHCKKQFDTTLQLKRHVRTHLSDKPYKCRICHKGFPEMSSLTRHFRRHTGETREKKHICKFCEKAYHDRHSLNVHTRKHTGERPWICSECGKGFIDSRLLNSHMKIHSDNKPFACNMCDKRFKHESTLTTHVRIHTGEKPYICTVCGNAFVQSSNLALHMRSHTQERPYSCKECPKKFSSSSALTTHRRIHTGEKPYSCNICQKKFARHDLSAHMRRHTGEKPHKCSVCSKKFTTIGQLNQHTRMHTGEKPFVCPICKKGCATSSYLKKHMARTHNNTNTCQILEDIKEEIDIKQDNSEIIEVLPKEIVKMEKRKVILRKIDTQDKIILDSDMKSNADENQIVIHGEVIENVPEVSNTLTTYSSNVLNVVTLATSNGEMSILSQKNDLNISTLKGQTGGNISTIVANSEEKIYQIDSSFLRIHQIASVQAGQVTIADVVEENIQEE